MTSRDNINREDKLGEDDVEVEDEENNFNPTFSSTFLPVNSQKSNSAEKGQVNVFKSLPQPHNKLTLSKSETSRIKKSDSKSSEEENKTRQFLSSSFSSFQNLKSSKMPLVRGEKKEKEKEKTKTEFDGELCFLLLPSYHSI